MKKRSNPIPLLSIAILCFALIGYLNFRSAPTSAADAQQQAQQPPDSHSPVGPERAAPSKSDIAGAVHVDSTAPPANTVSKPGMPPVPTGPRSPGGMMQMMQKKGLSKPPKPKPSDSSISTHWYSSDANQTIPSH